MGGVGGHKLLQSCPQFDAGEKRVRVLKITPEDILGLCFPGKMKCVSLSIPTAILMLLVYERPLGESEFTQIAETIDKMPSAPPSPNKKVYSKEPACSVHLDIPFWEMVELSLEK